jgi:hypothetical protein
VKPSIGRIVWYVLDAHHGMPQRIVPAIITAVFKLDEAKNVVECFDGVSDGSVMEVFISYPFSHDPRQSNPRVAYSETLKPEHWSWPPRV